MADIFDEVQDELNQDNRTQFWNTYKYAIYGGIALIVLGVAGNSGYQEYKTGIQTENSAQFDAGLTALDESNTDILKSLSQNGDVGYATLASFRLVQTHVENGDYAQAHAQLQQITETAPEPYNQLANVLSILYSDGNPAERLAQITPHTAEGKPWRHQSLIIATELALQAGNTTHARGFLQTLSNDTSTPRGMRSLAKQVLTTLPQ